MVISIPVRAESLDNVVKKDGFTFKLERTKNVLKIVDPVFDGSMDKKYLGIEIKVPKNTSITNWATLTLPTSWYKFENSSASTHSSFGFSMENNNSLTTIKQFINTLQFTISNPVDNGGEIQIVFQEKVYTSFEHPDGKRHYYSYVPDLSKNWMGSYNNAKSLSYKGLTGYLPTITSAAEHDFLYNNIAKDLGFLGGTRMRLKNGEKILDQKSIPSGIGDFIISDLSIAKDWYWVDGPEAGQIFFDNVTRYEWLGPYPILVGKAPEGVYDGWSNPYPPTRITSQPDNSGNGMYGQQEYVLQFGFVSKYLNDVDSAGSSTETLGYFVEFSEYGTQKETEWDEFDVVGRADIPQKIYVKGKNQAGAALTAGNQTIDTTIRIGTKKNFSPISIANYIFLGLQEPGGPTSVSGNLVVSNKKQDIDAIYSNKKTNVTVKYVDQSGKAIAAMPNKVINNYVGIDYDVSTAMYKPTISGYDIDTSKLPTNAKGKHSDLAIIVTYVYKQKSTVTVKYVDQSGKAITGALDKVANGYVGEPYDVTTDEYTPAINGYILDKTKIPDNVKGTHKQGQIVTYVYKKELRWGTSPWHFDDKTKTLTVEPGRLEHKIIGNPWKNVASGGGGLNPEAINKIIFEPGVVMPKDSSKFFEGLRNEVSKPVAFEGLEELDTSEVEDMSQMFRLVMNNFTEVVIPDWDVTNVVTMEDMFALITNDKSPIIKIDVSNWKLDSIENMKSMFFMQKATEIDVSNWNFSDNDTKNILTSFMFFQTKKLKKLEVSKWNTGSFKEAEEMFGASGIEMLDVSKWDVSSLTNGSYMFSSAASLSQIDVAKWQTSKLENMSGMFSSTYALKELNLSHWDTSAATDMSWMFADMRIETIDLKNFKTNSVTTMQEMFVWSHFKELNLSSFETPKVEDLSGMFAAMPNLITLNGLKFDVSKATSFQNIFMMTPLLEELDLSTWEINSDSESTENMFYEAGGIRKLSLGTGFKFVGKGTELLLDVVKNKEYTGKWKEMGTGTPTTPNGEFELTSTELMSTYDGTTMAGVYVWMPTGLNYQYKNRLSLTWVPHSFHFGKRTQISANSEFLLEEAKEEQWLIVTDNRAETDAKLGERWKVTARMSELKNSVNELVDNAELAFTLNPLKKYDIGEKWQEDYEDIIPNNPNSTGIGDFATAPADILIGGKESKIGNAIALSANSAQEVTVLEQTKNRTGNARVHEGFATKLSDQRLVIIGIKASTVKNDFTAKINWTMASDID